MGLNPFEPPSDLADGRAGLERDAVSGAKLYSPNQIAFGAFLGSPLASGWLMAQNYKTLGNPAGANKALAVGIVAATVLVVIGYLLPEGRGSSVLALAYPFGIREAARHLQGRDFYDNLELGGARHSSWRVAGIALVALLLFFVILFAFGLLGWGFGMTGDDFTEAFYREVAPKRDDVRRADAIFRRPFAELSTRRSRELFASWYYSS